MSLYCLSCIQKNAISNVIFLHSGKVDIQFQDSHSLHRVLCIASIIQFYERLSMLLLKAFGTIGSIQIFRHTNSLLGDHEKAFDLDKCVVGNVCIRSPSFVIQVYP